MTDDQQTDDEKAIARVRDLLHFYEHNHEVVFDIINLVQENQDFFGVKINDNCLRSALEKLRLLIKQEKN